MKIQSLQNMDLTQAKADSLVVFYTETKELPEHLKALDAALGGEIAAMIADEEATGKQNEVAHVRSNGRIAAKHLYLVGTGKAEKLDSEAVRKAAGAVSREVRGNSVAVALPGDEHASAVVEGLLLGSYTYKGHKSKPEKEKRFQEVTLLSSGDVEQALESGRINAEAVLLARDLTDRPGNILTPEVFANIAKETGEAAGLEVEVLDVNRLKELGMNLLLSVGIGSENPPYLVTLKYKGAPESQETLGLVGKGITYDTGGYIIKPEDGMGEMNTDMMGAACVLGAMQAIAKKKLRVNVIGVLALAENMISGRAFKPGDVATAFNGKTVEMIDTDCEGRLVLADGVAYVKHLGATKIVDTATLTGAVTVVLGRGIAASLYGNDESWIQAVKRAGDEVGEKLHALPNYPEFEELIESKIADFINYSGRNGAAVAGGAFIVAFADEVPAVHIDMANMSVAKESKGYTVAGATGFSTRTLIRVAENLAN
jgi:leucyl aminopeptidase